MDTPTFQQRQARATAFMDSMVALKGAMETETVAERYERLRERYVTDQIDLEDFAAGVVGLLRAGL